MSIAAQTTFVGIDVSGAELVVAVHGDDMVRTYPNDPAGITRLRGWLQRSSLPVRVAFEATGGYEWPVWAALDASDLHARQVSPAEVKALGAVFGQCAKTDKIDARAIAKFLSLRPDAGRKLPRENIRVLKELATMRRQRVEARSCLKQQMKHRAGGLNADLDAAHLAQLQAQIDTLDARITAMIDEDQRLRRAKDLLCSIPGIGPVVATTILAELPELEALNAKTVAALTGLAPRARDSGKYKGKRFIGGGRRIVRDALYMAATVAARHHPTLKDFYEKLRGRGLPYKKAITAVARKLAIEANAVIKRGTPWQKKPV